MIAALPSEKWQRVESCFFQHGVFSRNTPLTFHPSSFLIHKNIFVFMI